MDRDNAEQVLRDILTDIGDEIQYYKHRDGVQYIDVAFGLREAGRIVKGHMDRLAMKHG